MVTQFGDQHHSAQCTLVVNTDVELTRDRVPSDLIEISWRAANAEGCLYGVVKCDLLYSQTYHSIKQLSSHLELVYGTLQGRKDHIQ